MVMQIPTYKRRVERSTSAPGGVSNLQVNTGAWTAPGIALANAGQALQKWGLEKAELAAKSEAHNTATALNDELMNISRELLKSNDPGKADGEAEARFKNAYSKYLNGKTLSNNRSKGLFKTTGETAWRTSLSSFRTRNDPRILKHSQNRISSQISANALAAANLETPGPLAMRALQQVIGGEGFLGVFNSPEMQTNFSFTQIKQRKNEVVGRIFEDRAAALMQNSKELIVTESGLAKLMANDPILVALQNQIGPAKSGKLINTLFKQTMLLSGQRLDEVDKNERKEKARLKTKQDDNFSTYKLQLVLERTDSTIAKSITIETLNKEVGKRNITIEDYAKLVETLEGRDRIYNNEFYDSMIDDVDSSVTRADLEYHRNTTNEAFKKDEIGVKARDDILKRITSVEKNEPQYKEEQEYRSALKTSLSPPSNIVLRDFGKSTIQNMGEASAIQGYNSLVSNGMRPQEAYFRTLSTYADKENMLAFNASRSLPPAVLTALGVKQGVKLKLGDVQKFTTDNINAAQDVLENMAFGLPTKKLGDTKPGPQDQLTSKQLSEAQFTKDAKSRISKEDRISVRKLYALEIQLNVLRSSVEAREATANRVAIEAAKVKAKDKQNDSGLVKSMIDAILSTGGNDKDKATAEREKVQR
jgi:hypothetical protein